MTILPDSGAVRVPRGRRRLHAALAGLLAVAGLAGVGAAGAAAFTGAVHTASASNVVRLAGVDRYATAVTVSAATFPHGAPLVYLATGTDYPDALTAAAAVANEGPVLLTDPRALPPSTARELARLGPARVVIVGGDSAVSPAVAQQVQVVLPHATVSRQAGADRYATAVSVSAAMWKSSKAAYLATGLDYPDALAAAAATQGASPVLLVGPSGASSGTIGELRRLGVSQIVVVGGVGAISAGAFDSVVAALPGASVNRISGADRFATAAAVSAASFPTGSRAAYVATGLDFPDALTAAATGAGPVLLVDAGTVPSSTLTEINRLGAPTVYLVGGESAVSSAAQGQVQDAAARAAPPAAPGAATAVSVAQAQLGKPYVWAGAGPDSFDCSGLTMYAWAAAGVSLPHNAAAQAQLIRPISLSDLEPGDLVFYGSPIDHVGLYIGGGQMIEAAHTGAPVRIADIQRSDLVGAGRP